MKRGAMLVAGAVLLLAAVAGGVYLVPRLAQGGAAEAEARRFAPPERRRIAASVVATGVVRLRTGAEVRVGSQVSGIVEKLNVTVGSRIRRGDTIAQIDSRGLQARLAQARAQVGVVEQDLRAAQVELQRLERLAEKKLVAASQVEDAQIAVEQGKARLEKAQRDAKVVETELGYAVIRAPITGTIASVSTQEGETVAASFTAPTFVTIIGDNALQLIALVDETDIGGVAPGNPVVFNVEAYPSQEFTAEVLSIAPKGTIISGVVNYEVMIRITSDPGPLRPDMTANVSIRTAERDALVLPNASIQREASDRYVWIAQGSDIVRRDVVTGTREGGQTEIRRGLAGQERVLVNPPSPAEPAAPKP
jgi:macrolide-specific efflux system membrane fusion protein